MKRLLVTIVCVLMPAVLQADWPAFLGGQSRDSATAKAPLEWSADSGVTWQTPLPGHGQSSPVVVGDAIYTTAVDGPEKETNIVVCLDLATGKERWQHELESSLQVKNDVYTSRAAPTPVADQAGVIAFFESGDLVALDPQGQVRWQRDLLTDYGKYEGRFGLGGSPAQVADRVFVLADNEGPSYLLAVEKQTGKTLWKTDRESRTSWTSPMVLNVAGTPQIVVSSAGSVDGYDVDSGALLWSFTDVGGNTVASPVPFGDSMFLVGASPGRNGENADGARRSNMAMKIEKTADGFQPTVVWRNEKASSSFGSPIVAGDYAYYTNRAGVLFCLDAKTGEALYTTRLESNWATPLAIADRIYVFGKSGETSVLANGSEEKRLATNKLWQPTGDGGPGGFNSEIQYGVAITDAGIVVRTGDRMFLLGN